MTAGRVTSLIAGMAVTILVPAVFVPAFRAQPLPPGPSFAAATIKPDSDPDQAGFLRPTPGGLTGQNASVASYIRSAWKLKGDYELFVPPNLKAEADSRYAIVAKTDGTASRDQLMLMLQTLLMDRFHLAVHYEKRVLPVFAMTVSKDGPKQLRPATPDAVPDMSIDSAHPEGGQHWVFHNLPVSAVMGIMTNGLSRPLIDLTGMERKFDYDFILPTWNRADGALGDHVVSDVFPELQRQLGLKIQAQTAPVDVLVVDHLDKAPTEN